MTDPAPLPAAARPGRPLARLAVTIALPALVLLAHRVPMPGVDWTVLSRGGAPPAEAQQLMSAFVMGLGPFLWAFVLVELAATAWPRWRPLRVGGPAARARLEHSALWLGIALAALQAWALAVYLNSMGALPDTASDRGILVLTLVAASAVSVWVATLIGRWGLGSGFAVLLAAETLAGGPGVLRAVQGLLVPGSDVGVASIVAALVLPLVGVAIVLNLLLENERREGRGFEGVRLRDPASGLVPLSIATSALLVPATLSGWIPVLEPLALAARPGTVLHDGLVLVVGVTLAIWLAGVFHQPRRVAAVWGRLESAPPDPALREAQAGAALRTARVRSAVLVGVLLVLPAVVLGTHSGAMGAAALAFAAAAVADVLAEWRARSAEPSLVSVWPEHRLYAVDPALDALAAAGIRGSLRGVHYRTLGQFFAPYVPVEILVPAQDAAAAQAVLRRVLAGDGEEIASRATAG